MKFIALEVSLVRSSSGKNFRGSKVQEFSSLRVQGLWVEVMRVKEFRCLNVRYRSQVHGLKRVLVHKFGSLIV